MEYFLLWCFIFGIFSGAICVAIGDSTKAPKTTTKYRILGYFLMGFLFGIFGILIALLLRLILGGKSNQNEESEQR